MPETLEGLVIGRAPGYFVVRSEDGATRLCVIRGKLRRARAQDIRPSSPIRQRLAFHQRLAARSPTTLPHEDCLLYTSDAADE